MRALGARALGILALMVLMSASGLLQIMEAAFLAAGATIVSGCITASRARRTVDLPMLVVIAASFALGNSMTVTGAAGWVAGGLLGFGELTPWIMLVLICFLTAVFAEMITNNAAAAVLMFPIASVVSQQLGVNFLPYAVAVMFAAASASFKRTQEGPQTFTKLSIGVGDRHASKIFRLLILQYEYFESSGFSTKKSSL